MPVIFQIKGGENIFNPIFEDWDTEEELCKAWQVCTKVKDSLENGSRMENLSWRLWYLHQNMVKNKNITTKDFKKLSSLRKNKLLEYEPQYEKMFKVIKNVIDNQKKSKSKSDEKNESTDKLTTPKIKEETNTMTSLYSNLDTLTPSFSLNMNDSLLSSNQNIMDFIKMKNGGTSGIETLGISLNDSFNQNSSLLLNTDTPTQDDYSNITDLLNQYPSSQANIPVPQPPHLHIPDPSIRNEFSEIYLNNKLGKINDINSLYSNLYDDTINNEDPAFNSILHNLSPAITQQSSFNNNSFPGLTQNSKLDLFNSSTDSLSNSLSFSSSIPDDNVSISLMNQLSSLNNLNTSNLSSYSDLTNSSNLAALNNFTHTSPDILGLGSMTGATTLGALHDVNSQAALALDSNNAFTSSLLTNPSLLPTSLQHSLSASNSSSLSSTLVDNANAKKATTANATTNASKSTLNNALLSAVQGKTDTNNLFPITSNNTSNLLTSQNKATTLPLNLFNNTSDSMIIPVTSLGNNSITTAAVNGSPLALDVNGLDLNSINNQLLVKNMLKNSLAQNATSTTAKIDTTATKDVNHVNNTKISGDMVVPYDIHTTTNTSDALKSTKDNINSASTNNNTKLNDKVKLKAVKKELGTPTTTNTAATKKLANNTKETKPKPLSNQEIMSRLLLSTPQYNNLTREQLTAYAEQFSKLTKNSTDQIKKQNPPPSLINTNTLPLFDAQNAVSQLNKNSKTKEDFSRIIENIKTTQSNLLLNTTTQATLLNSLINSPLYKNLPTANGKIPIRPDGPSTPKTAPPILDSKLLPKNQKNDKLPKGKSKKANSTVSSATPTPTSAQLPVSATQSAAILKSMSNPDNLAALQKSATSTPTSSQTQTQTQTPTQQQQKPTANKKKAASLYVNQKTAAIDSMATQHVKPVCANCGVNHTPLWRRSANDEILCNACGLYQKLHKVPRPKSIRQHAVRKDTQAMTEHETTECSNCHTTNTPLWRRDENGATLCNACGLYQKMHHSARPISMKTDLPRKRQRFDSLPNIPGMPSPGLLTTPGLNSFLPYGNLCYPLGFGGIPGNSQFLYSPLSQAALSPALSDKSDKSSKSKKKAKANQTPAPPKKIKLSNPSPTVPEKKK